MENNVNTSRSQTYDLFDAHNNEGVERVIQVSDKKIIAYLNETLTIKSLSVYQITYNDSNKDGIPFKKKKLQGFSAEHKGNRIVLIGNFNPAFNYSVKINTAEISVMLDPTPGGILDDIFAVDEHEKLGVELFDDCISFKVWSPPAVCIKLLVYERDYKTLISSDFKLVKNQNGIHSLQIKAEELGLSSLEGCYYQYEVYAYGKRTVALDPYAKSMAPFDAKSNDAGKGAIFKLPPPRPENRLRNSDIIKSSTDVVAYEIHVRDFSIEPGFVDKSIAGCYSALTEKSSYFKELGVTHLQIMPVNKCHTQTDTDRRFFGDNDNVNNYNWGYDPLNYFTLEGRYAQNPFLPEARIYEFREMCDALHQQGVGIITDMVFNHSYSAETFENIAPGCYHRYTDGKTISMHTGAGPSIESRHITVRKFILDVLKYYVEILGVDGFRFDLMGFTDIETLTQIRKKTGALYHKIQPEDLLLWGEAWDFRDIDYIESFTKLHKPKGLKISMFNDIMRDAALGHTTEGGFFIGQRKKVIELASAVAGGVETYDAEEFPFTETDFFHPYNLFTRTPDECLNFLDIHDGLTLWDKINLSIKDSSKKLRLQIAKQALTALFTSQGRIILHGGVEVLRSKPVSGSERKNPRAYSTDNTDEEEGKFHFHDNSYKSADYTNMIRWSRLHNDYAESSNSMLNYVKGLILLRRTAEAFRYENTDDINQALRFLHNYDNNENRCRCCAAHSFKSYMLKDLHLRFINGPKNDILFLAGEIHPYEDNPAYHPIPVRFNREGEATVTFSRKEIDEFDLDKWEDYFLLNVKLVRTPGDWDIPQEYYSKSGSNALSPCDIDRDNRITIDLSVKDYSSDSKLRKIKQNYLAYSILNLYPKHEESLTSADCFFVIHNTADTELVFKNPMLAEYNTHKLFADSQNCSLQGLNSENSENLLPKGNTVKVPAHCSLIIGSFK